MTNHPNRSKQQQAKHTLLTKAKAKMLLALISIARAGEWGAGDYQSFDGGDYNTMVRAADKLILIAAARETAAERDRLKALNAELLGALKDAITYIVANEATRGTALSQSEAEKGIRDFRVSRLSVGHHSGHSYASIDLDKARAAIAKAEGR